MGSCVSKKAAPAASGGKVAAPLPPVKDNVLPPVVVEKEVKEVLSETPVARPRPPVPEQEKVKRKEDQEASESASVASAAAEKAKAGGEQEVEQRAVDAPEKGRARRRPPEQRKSNDAGNGRARSLSPVSAQRRNGAGSSEQPAATRPRREQPAVVSGIGCRSGRFSPSAARRAAESAVRRTHSAREADMILPPALLTPAKRFLNGSGNAYGGSAVWRDPGERSGRRPDSPTTRHLPTSPAANSAIQSQASAGVVATRKAAKENTTPEQNKPQSGGGGGVLAPGEVRDELDEEALAGGGEHREVAEGALGQNPSVAMECFIFL